jgi:hypothetical protein
MVALKSQLRVQSRAFFFAAVFLQVALLQLEQFLAAHAVQLLLDAVNPQNRIIRFEPSNSFEKP